MQLEAQNSSHAAEDSTLKFGADTGNSILLFPEKNASASVTARGYGLPFNNHGESTNLLSNKQIHLAWMGDSHSAIAYFCTALLFYPSNWEAGMEACHSLLLSSTYWSVYWCLQKAFLSRCAMYAYHILQISFYNPQQAVYLRVM